MMIRPHNLTAGGCSAAASVIGGNRYGKGDA